MRHRPWEAARNARAAIITMLAVAVVASAVGGNAGAQTGSSVQTVICNPQCTFDFNSGPGVVTNTLALPGPNGSFAITAIEVEPAEFSQSGDPEVDFRSFTQVVTTTLDFVSTTATTFFDQDQLVEKANAVLTETTSAVIDYSMDFFLELSGSATDQSFAQLETQWFFAPEGQQSGMLIDEGVTGLDVVQGNVVVSSTGHQGRDLSIVDMGGGLYFTSGSGQITVTGIPLNTTPRIGLGVFPSAHLEGGSTNAMALSEGPANAAAGIQFRLRPLDPLVTITAVPVPEPVAPGVGALVVLAVLARCRRNQIG